jgi:hypothetical protein
MNELYRGWRERSLFSLICRYCGEGEGVLNYNDAKFRGWKNLNYEPDGLYWTVTGVCPIHSNMEDDELDRMPVKHLKVT